MAIEFSPEQVRYARSMVRYLAQEWFGEVPLKIHVSSRVFDATGAPAFTEEFMAYVDDGMHEKRRSANERLENASPKRKVTSAFRTLRGKAPREYDAMRCLVVIDQVGRSAYDEDRLESQFRSSLQATARRFNIRAQERDRPERYTENDVLLLVVSAVEKLGRWAS